MVKKKKIVFHSDFALSKTGFGRNAKAILSYLYNTGKYDIISLAGGVTKNHPELERTPWRSVGVVPSQGPELQDFNSSPDKTRLYSYGAFEIDKIIENEKPDFYIGVQDFWGVDYCIDKPWFNKINSVIWTTLDSLPLLPSAISQAPKIKNYWVWSSFAEKEMHRIGLSHVKTLHGAIYISDFKPLPQEEKDEIRKNNNIPKKDFIIGFVFRNQLRKSVPNLLQGFKIFKDVNPQISAKLLLHTHWQEGWNIHKLCKETGVAESDVLTTYVCRNCKAYEIKNFSGPEVSCKFCRTNNSQITTGVACGVNEKQLNEIYNCMDVYCHPFTSGGQEIPIQEAKLTGLITLVTNYSCGEEMCCPEAASIPLDWSEYREFGTEFIKASTCPKSIAKNLETVFKMDSSQKQKMGRTARKWVIENFSASFIGGKIEKFLDSQPFSEYCPEDSKNSKANPEANIDNIEDNILWLKTLYFKILGRIVKDNDEGLTHWIEKINSGVPRDAIVGFFRDVARQEVAKFKNTTVDNLFIDSEKKDRIFVSINSSKENVFLSTKIISSIKKKQPNKKIFVHTNKDSAEIFFGNTDVHEVLVQGKDLSNLEFLRNNFESIYCLDNFSINNFHSVLVP
jgi:glycosyltransferase involved in cell wall biosynthesis